MVSSFFRNTRLLVLVVALIIGWGISSFQSLPRQEDPELVSRTAVVKTAYPGASAQRVEALVTEVLESELAEIEEVNVLESDSRIGFSTVSVELVDAVNNPQPIWSKVRDEMDDAAAMFPPGAAEPELDEVKIKAYTIITALTWERSDEPNYGLLRRYAEELETRLRGVQGTEEVELFGAPDEEIAVEIDAAELVAVGLSPRELADRIALSDAKISAGQLRSRKRDLAIEVESELETLDQIRRIPIQNSSEQFTRLGDIARVSRGIQEPPTDLTLVSGKDAIALGVLMKSGLRIDRWTVDVQQQIEEFEGILPRGMGLETIFAQNSYVNERINALIANLIFGALLVTVVVLVAMGWRSALVVGSALPLTAFAVLGWMSVFGIAIHQMSVTGLIVALGLLIDNAIVVVDEIQIEMQHGEKAIDAVLKTVDYLRVPLFASTLTTVLTFLPIALLPGGPGEFVGPISLSVILSLISSLALSLTIVASLAGRSLLRTRRVQNRSDGSRSRGLVGKIQGFLFRPGAWWHEGITPPRSLSRFYRRTLELATTKPIFAILLSLSIPLVGFAFADTLDEQFFPLVERDQFQIEVEFAPDTAIAQTREQMQRVRELMLEKDRVEDVHWFIGESGPKFYYNFTGARENQAHYARGMVQVESEEGVTELVKELQRELDAAFPSARILVRKFIQGPPYDAPVEMRIYGSNTEELRRLGNQVREIMASIPEVTHVRDDLSEASPKLGFYVDDEQAQQVGLSNTAIAQQLEAYLEGAVGGSILEETENLPVRVRLTNRDRASLEQIASLNLRPSGASDRQFRPSSALGEFNLVPQAAKISRRNEQRVNTVQAYIAADVLSSNVLEEFQRRLAAQNFKLPLSYRYEFGGEQAERSDAVADLLLYIPLLTLVMITALVLSLSSFRQTGIIAVVALGSVGMALLALRISNSLLGFMAIVGSMGLIGIAINDVIVVLSAFNADDRARLGDPKAVREVVVKATRHVLTTTATTTMGFVPLLLDGDPFWRPLAIAISCGIAGSSFLAIYFAPAAYILLYRPRWQQVKSKWHEQPI